MFVALLSLANGNLVERLAILGAAEAEPFWCNYIPGPYRKYVPQCAATASLTDMNLGAAPFWCEYIPTPYRSMVPGCDEAAEEELGAAPFWCQYIPTPYRSMVPGCDEATLGELGAELGDAPFWCQYIPTPYRSMVPGCDAAEMLEACPDRCKQPNSPICWCSGNYAPVMENLEMVQASTLQVSWTDCGNGAHTKVTGLSPSSMTLGATTTMTGTGTLDETVTSGTFEMKLKAGGGMLRQTFRGDICKPSTFKIKALGMSFGQMTWKGMNCPVAAGPSTLAMDVMLKGSVPKNLAKSTITVNAKDQNGGELVCLQVNTK